MKNIKEKVKYRVQNTPGRKSSELNRNIRNISEGVISKVTDAVLVSIFYGFGFALAGHSDRGLKAGQTINELYSEINYESIKRALAYLKKKGLVEYAKEKVLTPIITSQGKKRLSETLPFYDSKRVWDERVYLVTYDIPKEKNKTRNKLREYLKKVGCGMLQESIWLTCYNPKELIEEFIETSDLESDLIIVSTIGKDGTIGKLNLPELLDRVYKLAEINARYAEFLNLVKTRETSKESIIFSYLSILRDDPQLPFELLPVDWLGDKAYKIYDRVTSKK